MHEKKFSLNINHIRVNHIIYIFFSYALQEVNDKRVREIVNRERNSKRKKSLLLSRSIANKYSSYYGINPLKIDAKSI